MVTYSQVGIYKLNPKYALMVLGQGIPRIPKSIKVALQHDGWKSAMQEKMDVVHYNCEMGLLNL